MEHVEEAASDINKIVDDLIVNVKLHSHDIKREGVHKMLSLSFLKDGKQMAIQTIAEPESTFDLSNHHDELREKLQTFIALRRNSIFSKGT